MADNADFIQEALKAHNIYRENHGVPALTLNDDITAKAQKWADHMAKSGDFSHCPDRDFKDGKLGENIAMKWTSSGEPFTGQQVTDQWYSEIERYDFDNHKGKSSGHFTQVVWKASEQFGIGRVKAPDGKWLVVGNYFPAGNFIGQDEGNVFPPKNGITKISKDDGKDNNTAELKPAGDENSAGKVISTTTETSTEVRDGVTYTKTITKETVEAPNGTKKVTTREVITTDKNVKDGAAAKDVFPVKKADTSEEGMEQFRKDVVEHHNKRRADHGAKEVTHNEELSAMAQKWADHLVKANALSHSTEKYKGDQLGENIASKWSSVGADYTGEQVVDQWYSEIKDYEFKSNDFKKGTGHFSQVVWKNTKQIGIGKSFSDEGRVFVVVMYHPPGNVIGRFLDNVQDKETK